MDIGRLHLDCRSDDEVGELDDRGIVARLVASRAVVLATRLDIGILVIGVYLRHGRVHLGARSYDRLDVKPVQDIAKRIDGIVAHRVRERDGDRVIVGDNRHYSILLRNVGGDRLDHFGIDRVGIYVAVL